jgi:hypothetical protein
MKPILSSDSQVCWFWTPGCRTEERVMTLRLVAVPVLISLLVLVAPAHRLAIGADQRKLIERGERLVEREPHRGRSLQRAPHVDRHDPPATRYGCPNIQSGMFHVAPQERQHHDAEDIAGPDDNLLMRVGQDPQLHQHHEHHRQDRAPVRHRASERRDVST